jgi:hypothetical protein
LTRNFIPKGITRKTSTRLAKINRNEILIELAPPMDNTCRNKIERECLTLQLLRKNPRKPKKILFEKRKWLDKSSLQMHGWKH